MEHTNFKELELKNLNGKKIELPFDGVKAVLIVNIASKCGFTPQLDDLEKLYQRYKERGLLVIGFPSNDFNQEPLEGEGVEEFCSINYGVSFPIMAKGSVKGSNAQEFFKYMKNNGKGGKWIPYPFWNFQKYLMNKDGKIIDYYLTFTKPMSPKIIRAIEKLLQ